MALLTPPLDIPDGASAKLSVIDNTFLSNIAVDNYIHPKVPGHDHFNIPSYAFLIENHRGRKVMFDLALRKDWIHLTPIAHKEIEGDCIKIRVDRDVVEILEDHGTMRHEIEAIILSHHHWDHIGDPSVFPPTTKLVVGPGFLKAFTPGYPEDRKSPIRVSDYSGRVVEKISFNLPAPSTFKIGMFPAHDYFGDGSLYLLNSPGHSIGHICALVRTTTSPPTFALLGADACHHPGEFRPSRYLPIPESITPNPLDAGSAFACPGAKFVERQESLGRDGLTPFFGCPLVTAGPSYTHDVEATYATIEKIQSLDASENILTIIAHDNTIQDILPVFPKDINDWKKDGLGTKTRWKFLSDFKQLFNEVK